MNLPPEIITLAVVVSFAITSLIIIVTSGLFRRKGLKFDFIDIARDSEGYPSLARFQFLVWTIVILFGILSINILRLHPSNQNQDNFSIQPGLLALMGISVAVTPTSAYVSKLKYGEPSGKKLQPQTLIEERKEKTFAAMLLESGRPSLTRFQMFSWTIISVSIYSAQLFSTFIGPLSDFAMPDVDPVMVMLMGLSQVAYVGGKWISPSSMSIKKVYPLEGLTKGDIVTIVGTNFGREKASIELNGKKMDDTTTKLTITKGDEKIESWDDTIIEIKLKKSIKKIDTIKLDVKNREAIWPKQSTT